MDGGSIRGQAGAWCRGGGVVAGHARDAARRGHLVRGAVRGARDAGLGEGVNFPSIHSLTARWMPARERARTLSLNFSGMYLGTIVALLLSPPIIAALGWPWLFYLSGAAGLLWVAAWMAGVSDAPREEAAVTS